MDEHVIQNNSALHLSLSTLQGNSNYVPPLAENTFYQQHLVQPEDHDNYSLPEWIGYQHLAPYYAESLAGNGISYMQREIPYKNLGIGCSSTPEESFLSMNAQQARHSRQQHEEVLVNNLKDKQHEICYQEYQKQGTNESLNYAAQYQPNMSVSTSGIRTKSRKTYLKQKASDSDRRRRTRIAAALDAMEELLPQSREGNKTKIVDDCVDYVKSLQLHLKELSQNRLGGEPTSNQLMHLEGRRVETRKSSKIGYGYYLVNESTASGPLQDILGKLLEENPSEATKLLESRDLFMMPIAPN